MALSKKALQELYRKRAGAYDFSANLYYLIGFREAHYRKQAVAMLGLRPGDTVVELGCGTGLNFAYLLETIGDSGRLIGVDLTDAMLEKAGKRVTKHGWKNVELVSGDAARFPFPGRTNGILSTFALTLMPEYETILANASRALADDGRLVILDFKLPEGWPLWLVKTFVMLTRPFGVTLDLAEREPWKVMQRVMPEVIFSEMYGGLVYISTGSIAKGSA